MKILEIEKLMNAIIHVENMVCVRFSRGEGELLTSKHTVLMYLSMKEKVDHGEIT